MGEFFLDKYSILHFSVGCLWQYFNLSLNNLIIMHILFEIIENTENGMYFINNYITFWPGGKPKADTIKNSFGDILSSIIGFYVMKKLNNIIILYASLIIVSYFWMI